MPTPLSNQFPAHRTRLLITAGPTHEPIDAVRYIGNRSSGRLGIALADHAAANGWEVKLLLGPTGLTPADSRVVLERFRTTAELQSILGSEFPRFDALIMAAAVADYRPIMAPAASATKLKRDAAGLKIELEATPDLLAGVAAAKRPGQVVVGFALEPEDRLLESARSKLIRKGLDLIVANPLGTMESENIHATMIWAGDRGSRPLAPMPKQEFARVLIEELAVMVRPHGYPTTHVGNQ